MSLVRRAGTRRGSNGTLGLTTTRTPVPQDGPVAAEVGQP